MTLLDSVLPFSAGLLSVPVVTASLFCTCPFPWARCAAFSIASAIQYCWYFGGRPLLVFPWIWNIFEAQGSACMDRQSLMAARKSTILSARIQLTKLWAMSHHFTQDKTTETVADVTTMCCSRPTLYSIVMHWTHAWTPMACWSCTGIKLPSTSTTCLNNTPETRKCASNLDRVDWSMKMCNFIQHPYRTWSSSRFHSNAIPIKRSRAFSNGSPRYRPWGLFSFLSYNPRLYFSPKH